MQKNGPRIVFKVCIFGDVTPGLGYSFLCLVLRLAGACLFACNAAALDDGFREGRNGNCQDI
jgi:hypothetical protein